MKATKNQVVKVGNSITPEMVRGRILTFRGVQVLLDRDLAELYGVPTGALNQAVKRNSNRFPERFMFQLSEEEFKNWKSQIVISNLSEATVRMGLRKRPFVFTEHGVAMLASVLRSETAVRVSLAIIDAFIAMRRLLNQISDADIETFNAQYPKLAVRYNESFHDRFLIIDDRELYLIGASLKDLGAKCFGFTKMDSAEITRIKKSAFSQG